MTIADSVNNLSWRERAQRLIRRDAGWAWVDSQGQLVSPRYYANPQAAERDRSRHGDQ